MIQQILIISGFLMAGIGFAFWPRPEIKVRNEIIYDAKEIDLDRFLKPLFRDVHGNEWRVYSQSYSTTGIEGALVTLRNEGKPGKAEGI